MAEKFTASLPVVRCGESLETALMRLASRHDRVLSDYIRRVLEHHCFGHAANLAEECDKCGQSNAMHCNARKRGARE